MIPCLAQLTVDWSERSNVHVVGLAFTVALAFGMLVLPRRWAIGTLLALACFIPSGQRLIVLGLHFYFLRILVLVGWLRVLVRRDHIHLRLNALDALFVAWIGASLAIYSLQHATTSAFVFKVGTAYDAIGLYFLFRCLLRDLGELKQVGQTLAWLAVPVCLAFLVEASTGRNLFSVFGGVPEFTSIREGRIRCQGAFSHPILAGCFWVAAWPLIASGWWSSARPRTWSAIGSVCALFIVAMSGSSTPTLGTLAVLGGGCAFAFRRFLRVGRVALLFVLVGLHLTMTGPVWHLLARVNVLGGSTGWHRFFLVDQAIAHFGEWWLLGTASTAHWGTGLGDVTSQYVLEATTGGLLGLLLFLGLFLIAFRIVGRAWRALWPSREDVAVAWAMGVSLLAQTVMLVAVAYFDQSGIIWFLVLAGLASVDTLVRAVVSPGSRVDPPTAHSTVRMRSNHCIAGPPREAPGTSR